MHVDTKTGFRLWSGMIITKRIFDFTLGTQATQSELDTIMNSLDNVDIGNISNNRGSKRFSYRHTKTFIYRKHVVNPYLLATRNISKGGFSFLFDEEMLPGEQLRILLSTPNNTKLTSLLGHVVYCRNVKNSIHDIGVKFDGVF